MRPAAAGQQGDSRTAKPRDLWCRSRRSHRKRLRRARCGRRCGGRWFLAKSWWGRGTPRKAGRLWLLATRRCTGPPDGASRDFHARHMRVWVRATLSPVRVGRGGDLVEPSRRILLNANPSWTDRYPKSPWRAEYITPSPDRWRQHKVAAPGPIHPRPTKLRTDDGTRRTTGGRRTPNFPSGSASGSGCWLYRPRLPERQQRHRPQTCYARLIAVGEPSQNSPAQCAPNHRSGGGQSGNETKAHRPEHTT